MPVRGVRAVLPVLGVRPVLGARMVRGGTYGMYGTRQSHKQLLILLSADKAAALSSKEVCYESGTSLPGNFTGYLRPTRGNLKQ